MIENVEMLVCPEKGAEYELQTVAMDSTPRENELLVRMVATGVCMTDFKTCSVRPDPPLQINLSFKPSQF